ncbi:MAG: hypothetical protein JWN70_745 [Planctomycetaceae bacterium]|nr:hypothetical protein [Planctomycetaceae bacterium]
MWRPEPVLQRESVPQGLPARQAQLELPMQRLRQQRPFQPVLSREFPPS